MKFRLRLLFLCHLRTTFCIMISLANIPNERLCKDKKMERLILDGYNVIHKIPSLKRMLDLSLEKARNRLGDFLLEWKRTTGFRGKVTVVFDGKGHWLLDGASSYHGIEFLFSTERSDADRYIITLLNEFAGRDKVTVITEDNFIRNHCRVYQARCHDAAWLSMFVLPGAGKRSRKPAGKKSIGKDIPPKDMLDINRYLKDIWGIK